MPFLHGWPHAAFAEQQRCEEVFFQMSGQPYARRLNELEQRFMELAPSIGDSPEKEALSVLHGMVQEVWRTIAPASQRAMQITGLSLDDIASMYKQAPDMDGGAMSQPLPVG